MGLHPESKWHDGGRRRGMSDVRSSSNMLFTFRKSWGFLFKQLCFTITHIEFLLCWHIWNYCTGSEPPRMTENRKIWVGCAKGDTLVTKLQCLVLASEGTECQLQSRKVVKTNESINHSLHINCIKKHLTSGKKSMSTEIFMGEMNTYIYCFYVFNDVRVVCPYTHV